ncbi:MAG TPA: hypothetical protein VMT27_07780 [Actinomycetes bacterium]|nr:hypothetical protein [Actinomycetes bacterium]
MRDLDIHRELDKMSFWSWLKFGVGTAALAMFVVGGFYHVWWLWGIGWPTLALAAYAEHKRRRAHAEVRRLMSEAATDPWWLGVDHPVEDWRSHE